MHNLRRKGLPPKREPAPDAWQLLGVTLLVALCFIPLLFELHAQVAGFIVCVFVLRLISIRWPRLRPGVWILALLTLAGALNVIDAYRGIAGQTPGTALLLTMMALKLLEVRRLRDLRVLLLLFGFLLVVQFLFDESALRTALMTLLLFANLALLFDINKTSRLKALLPRAKRAAQVAGVITLQALPLALVLFLFFPRLDAPLWNLGIENEFAITGLQDWLEPGSIRDLVVSGEDALRVRFDRPPGIAMERMYWRGIVVWHTDGSRWTPAAPDEFPDAGTEVRPIGESLGYGVALERTDQRWLIGLDMPIDIPSDAHLTNDFQVLAAQPVEDLRFYRMTSAPDYRTEGLSLLEEAAATALPDNVTPRMRALAARWAVDGASPGEIVQRALNHFNQQEYYYTLLPPDLGENPMDAFLFDAKSGFCEHYAGGFALMMRIAGIPTRIVLGYLGAEFNPLSGDYVIRQSDAHAWNEVWLEESGWVRIDPTASVHPARVDADSRLQAMGASAPVRFRIEDQGLIGGLLHQAHLLTDALNAGWRQWVVGFSRHKQQRLLDALGLGHLRDYGLALAMTIGAAAVMLVWSFLLGRRPVETDPVNRAYQGFLRKLEPLGLGRQASEGPLEHRDRVIAKRPDLKAAVDDILGHYLRLHFAGIGAGEERDKLRKSIRSFVPTRRPPTDDSR
ncbi:MAG: DUF3488 and transglutaminase-like domain-containing protein [Thiohalocapsa sp.]